MRVSEPRLPLPRPTSIRLPPPLPIHPHTSPGEHDDLLFEEGSVLPLVVACQMGSPPEVINALLAAGAKPKPAIHAVCNPQSDPDGKSCQRIELIMHATKTRALRGQAVQVQGLENRPDFNGCRGTIDGDWAGLGRWPVRLVVDDKVLSLKCENVVFLPKDERQIQPEAPTCAAQAGPGQDSACEDRDESPLATSTTAMEDSTASAEDNGGEAPDVEDALTADGDIIYQRDALQMLLLLACKFDHPESLREHLMDGLSADFVDADGHSPLFHAVAHGHEECVKVLLDAKVPLDPPELMCYAVAHPSVLALLLDANASPNGSDKVQPPLIIAGVRGQPESMQMLLDAGARCDSDWPEDAAYPAWARVSMLLDQNGEVINQWHMECLHLLMQRDEKLHSKASTAVENLEQLLCAMCLQGSPTGIQILLNVGTNPDAIPTGYDVPPLVLTCTDKSSHHLECVRVLLHGTHAGPLQSACPCLYLHLPAHSSPSSPPPPSPSSL